MLLKRFTNRDLNKGRARQEQQEQRTETPKNSEGVPVFKNVTLQMIG
jgi:hypothetical protein